MNEYSLLIAVKICLYKLHVWEVYFHTYVYVYAIYMTNIVVEFEFKLPYPL